MIFRATLAGAFLVALITCNASAGSAYAISPKDVSLQVLDQCSRAAPKAEALWLPTEAEIRRVEAKAPDWLRAAGYREAAEEFASQPKQYVGIVRGGKRFVYANVVTAQAAADIDIATVPIVVCDGGKAFFGVEFDLESGNVTHFAANGQA